MSTAILFWDVDTQADFIDPEGKLYVPGAESIIPNLARLTDWAGNNGTLVIASACAHREGDAEFQQYPPHCLVGTPGQQKIPETRLPNALVVPNRAVKLPADLTEYEQVILEKQELNVFSNPNTESVLKQLSPVREIVLYGVVTEICVAYAARELLARGYRLQIVSDAVRALDEGKARTFLEGMRTAGADLTTTEQVIGELSERRVA